LPGIGPSTAAAIAAFCFGHREAILDGNVKRVLARALGVAGMAWPQALELALRGPTRRMDVGELITPRLRVPFFSSLAAGFDAAVAMRALSGPRSRRAHRHF